MLYKSREAVINQLLFYKSIEGTRLKIPTLKRMIQRLPIALAQVKAGNNNLENLWTEIRKIVYSLYQSKKITKNV